MIEAEKNYILIFIRLKKAMRNILLQNLLCALLLTSCQKHESKLTDQTATYLSTHLSPSNYQDINWNSKQENRYLIRLSTYTSKHKQILLQKKVDGSIHTGKILEITGVITNNAYQGFIEVSNLDESNKISSVIQNGYIRSLHSSRLSTTSTNRSTSECRDCTIPEVIVSASYQYPSYYDPNDPFGWLNLFWLFGGDMPKTEYLPLGGGSESDGASATFDEEVAEKHEKIDPKKFTDCFDQLPDNGTTTYALTISADIPFDNDPYTFFDWTTQFPGHAFIELSKSSPYGSVTQNLGFYPGTSYKVLSGHDIHSKIVDNGTHEYNARYTITVSAAQFQAAIQKLNSISTKAYNVTYYNCTDFALDVFNAAGGNLTIPKYLIPGFGVPGGSNTPQGLYQQIEQLKNAGATGTTTTNNKEYATQSKGPCN